EDGNVGDAMLQLCITGPLKLVAAHHGDGVDTGALSNDARCRGIIAGDHHHLDAGLAALVDRRLDTRSERIGEAREADELEREIVLAWRPGRARDEGAGDAENA